MIYLTSDLHFNHDREFIYKPRGFNSVEEMNSTIIANFNEVVTPDDDVYVLGDLMLGGPDKLDEGLNLISKLNGKLHLVRGNHDTDKRWAMYSVLPNVVEYGNAIYLKYKGFHFYMSHYPTFTANLEKESLKQCTINLYGHTHQHDSKFYNDIPFMYCCCLDCHENYPVSISRVIYDMYEKVEECKKQL